MEPSQEVHSFHNVAMFFLKGGVHFLDRFGIGIQFRVCMRVARSFEYSQHKGLHTGSSA